MIQEHYKLTFVQNQRKNFKKKVGSTNNFYFLLSENFQLLPRFAFGGYAWLSWDSSQYTILQLWAWYSNLWLKARAEVDLFLINTSFLFLWKLSLKNASYHENNMIYKVKHGGLYQNKVKFSSFSPVTQRANGRNNSHCWSNDVGSYCVRLHVGKR